jgi:hypothetical protein
VAGLSEEGGVVTGEEGAGITAVAAMIESLVGSAGHALDNSGSDRRKTGRRQEKTQKEQGGNARGLVGRPEGIGWGERSPEMVCVVLAEVDL